MLQVNQVLQMAQGGQGGLAFQGHRGVHDIQGGPSNHMWGAQLDSGVLLQKYFFIGWTKNRDMCEVKLLSK